MIQDPISASSKDPSLFLSRSLSNRSFSAISHSLVWSRPRSPMNSWSRFYESVSGVIYGLIPMYVWVRIHAYINIHKWWILLLLSVIQSKNLAHLVRIEFSYKLFVSWLWDKSVSQNCPHEAKIFIHFFMDW
jgi:hypothetical protein